MRPSFPKPKHVPIEEVNEFKATISRLEKDNEMLQLNLNWVTLERNELRFNLDQK